MEDLSQPAKTAVQVLLTPRHWLQAKVELHCNVTCTPENEGLSATAITKTCTCINTSHGFIWGAPNGQWSEFSELVAILIIYILLLEIALSARAKRGSLALIKAIKPNRFSGSLSQLYTYTNPLHSLYQRIGRHRYPLAVSH